MFTSAAMLRLTVAQRNAALDHERAHLRGRHHLLVASAALLAQAFPRVTLFDECRRHTVRLTWSGLAAGVAAALVATSPLPLTVLGHAVFCLF